MSSRRAPSSAHRGWRSLLGSERGIAATEFGLIAPVFFLLVFGLLDLGHMLYARVLFDGAVERAARMSTLEGANTSEADDMVLDQIRPVLPDVVLRTTRRGYYDFADLERPEKWTDNKGQVGGTWTQYPGLRNGTCDHGEPFVDENGNGNWDRDIGAAGNGGAGDVILYVAEAEYTPLFKVPFLPSAWIDRTLTATAVKKNQPFANQTRYGATAGTCS